MNFCTIHCQHVELNEDLICSLLLFNAKYFFSFVLSFFVGFFHLDDFFVIVYVCVRPTQSYNKRQFVSLDLNEIIVLLNSDVNNLVKGL